METDAECGIRISQQVDGPNRPRHRHQPEHGHPKQVRIKDGLQDPRGIPRAKVRIPKVRVKRPMDGHHAQVVKTPKEKARIPKVKARREERKVKTEKVKKERKVKTEKIKRSEHCCNNRRIRLNI